TPPSPVTGTLSGFGVTWSRIGNFPHFGVKELVKARKVVPVPLSCRTTPVGTSMPSGTAVRHPLAGLTRDFHRIGPLDGPVEPWMSSELDQHAAQVCDDIAAAGGGFNARTHGDYLHGTLDRPVEHSMSSEPDHHAALVCDDIAAAGCVFNASTLGVYLHGFLDGFLERRWYSESVDSDWETLRILAICRLAKEHGFVRS